MHEEVTVLSRDTFKQQLERGQLEVFRYIPNTPGFRFLGVCSVLLCAIAGGVYTFTGFNPAYWAVIAGIPVVGAFVLVGLVTYWTHFARHSLIAFDDAHLYVMRAGRTHQIPWSHVSSETAGFDDEHKPGVLPMRLNDQTVDVYLFNPFVRIGDFPVLLAELLGHVKRNQRELGATDPNTDA